MLKDDQMTFTGSDCSTVWFHCLTQDKHSVFDESAFQSPIRMRPAPMSFQEHQASGIQKPSS